MFVQEVAQSLIVHSPVLHVVSSGTPDLIFRVEMSVETSSGVTSPSVRLTGSSQMKMLPSEEE